MSLLKIASIPAATVSPRSVVTEAVQLMNDKRVGAVAVIDNDALVGIFTERDVMIRVVQEERNPRETLVRDVMTSPVETASEKTTATEALALMLDRHLRHLPILGSKGQLLGILSTRNLLTNKVEDLENQLNSLDQFLLNDGPGG
ncbi:MAG: CBS domain-containing protein [Acidobacteria bacterium]|nr:CBS domain-containing protein [Acidobacteriota bacterium]